MTQHTKAELVVQFHEMLDGNSTDLLIDALAQALREKGDKSLELYGFSPTGHAVSRIYNRYADKLEEVAL
jgi:anthranilate phosphoribosyltransferase